MDGAEVGARPEKENGCLFEGALESRPSSRLTCPQAANELISRASSGKTKCDHPEFDPSILDYDCLDVKDRRTSKTPLMAVNVLDLSAYIGLTAVGAVTLNMLLGTLMALRYSPVRSWPYRRFNYFRLHRWCGHIALAVSALHPLVLLVNSSPKFVLADLFYPVHSPGKPIENTGGAVALYLISIVVITSYFRVRLGRRLWKAFHFCVYFAAVALFFHSLLIVPDLKSGSVDWFDGGKVFIMGCLTLVTAAGLLRWRWARTQTKAEVHALPRTAALR